MKVEQACRFRTTAGYGFTARSAGIDRAQESALADVFNDSMSGVFPKLGTSILSCAVNGPYVFFSRNTLRTHETRASIFTHSYVIPAEAYTRMMQEMPQQLLAVPASSLMDVQNCGENLELAEFPSAEYGELSLDELFAKYRLTPQRYSRLLMGAYDAMTSNRSLRLYTNKPIEETDQVVRELTCCIVDGLLPVMKGNVTFSSGPDTRMKISVLQAGNPIQSRDLVFGVEDDSYTNISYRDDLSKICFQALGATNREERHELLQKMQDWLGEITNVDDGLSLMLICTAYVYSSLQEPNHDLFMNLFRSFARAAGKSLSLRVANALLTSLVNNLIEYDMVSTKALSNIAEWYLMDSSKEYRSAADKALTHASEAVCVALADAVVKMPVTDNVRELIFTLVGGISADSPELNDDVKLQLLFWIIRENANELADFCEDVMKTYTAAQTAELAAQILASAGQRGLNSAEIAVVARALQTMSPDNAANTWFNKETYDRLDEHMDELRGSYIPVLVSNFLNIRVRLYPRIQDQLELLMRLTRKYPEFRIELENTMQSAGADDPNALLWEHYQTEVIFTEDVTGDKVYGLCKKYNTFMNASGPFERKAMDILGPYIRLQMSNAFAGDEGVQKADDLAMYFLRENGKLKASEELKTSLKRFVLNEFWGMLTYEHILKIKKDVSFELRDAEVLNARFKCPLVTACTKIMSKPDQAQDLIELVTRNTLSEQDQQLVQQLMLRVASNLMSKKYFVSWDLLLLYCWVGGEEYDIDLLSDKLLDIREWLEKRKISIRSNHAADSILLKNEKLSKLVRKNLSQETDLAYELVAELKGSRGGLFGRKSEPAVPERRRQNPANPDRTAGGQKSEPASSDKRRQYASGPAEQTVSRQKSDEAKKAAEWDRYYSQQTRTTERTDSKPNKAADEFTRWYQSTGGSGSKPQSSGQSSAQKFAEQYHSRPQSSGQSGPSNPYGYGTQMPGRANQFTEDDQTTEKKGLFSNFGKRGKK